LVPLKSPGSVSKDGDQCSGGIKTANRAQNGRMIAEFYRKGHLGI
jgi:hypothetical protein